MKAILIIILSICAATFIIRVAYAEPMVCPAGTYNIGEKNSPLCKKEPTGCPYGDSIPLDSPKCAPPIEQQEVKKSTYVPETFTEMTGK